MFESFWYHIVIGLNNHYISVALPDLFFFLFAVGLGDISPDPSNDRKKRGLTKQGYAESILGTKVLLRS